MKHLADGGRARQVPSCQYSPSSERVQACVGLQQIRERRWVIALACCSCRWGLTVVIDPIQRSIVQVSRRRAVTEPSTQPATAAADGAYRAPVAAGSDGAHGRAGRDVVLQLRHPDDGRERIRDERVLRAMGTSRGMCSFRCGTPVRL
jgi:hypothetical protein